MALKERLEESHIKYTWVGLRRQFGGWHSRKKKWYVQKRDPVVLHEIALFLISPNLPCSKNLRQLTANTSVQLKYKMTGVNDEVGEAERGNRTVRARRKN